MPAWLASLLTAATVAAVGLFGARYHVRALERECRRKYRLKRKTSADDALH